MVKCHVEMASTATTTIDKAGRIVIPRNIRRELQLEAGDSLALEAEGERATIWPLRGGGAMRKELGVWVFHGRKPLSLEDANRIVRETRERRDQHVAGGSHRK